MENKEKLLKELDRRIKNVKQVCDWQKKNAYDYFEAFKRHVASDLTFEGLAAGALDSKIQEAIRAYYRWQLVEAERKQLEAFREDIMKGRVSIDG